MPAMAKKILNVLELSLQITAIGIVQLINVLDRLLLGQNTGEITVKRFQFLFVSDFDTLSFARG